MAILVILGILSFWILMPLVPAIILFKMLPANKIKITGPLAGPLGKFKLNASGAVAAYFAVLIALAFFILKVYVDNKDAASNPPHNWKISGKIQLLDVNKKEHPFAKIAPNRIKVSIDPDPMRVDAVAELDIKLVIDKDEPVIIVSIDKFGTGRIKIKKNSPDLEFKEGNIINIKHPLQIWQDPAFAKSDSQAETEGTSVGAGGTAAPN